MYRTLLLALAVLFISGCKQPNSNSSNFPALNVEVGSIERCSSNSPEIKISNLPSGTVEFLVDLQDLDVPSWNHGGGKYKNENGLIPEGALKRNYNGPCPPSGTHSYVFTVIAKDAGGNTLSKGKYKFQQ